jgi:hypothetical protein
MVGITVAILVSIGSAAGVLAVVARRGAPQESWRQLLRDGVRGVRSKELSLVSELRSSKDVAPGSLTELFTVAEPVEWPAYTEVTELKTALARARRLTRR